MKINIGLITEGITDQIVIRHILLGYFGEDNIEIRDLQPEKNKDKFGNWLNVFNYCHSNDFRLSLKANDYLIIQIDTDVSQEKGFDISQTDENGDLVNPEELIRKVKAKLVELIGTEFYQEYYNKIIFAISVHSIECWLLPLYYQDSNKQKTERCFNLLGKKINELYNQKKIKFYFDLKNKTKISKHYREISKEYLNIKKLEKGYPHNPSFKVFIEELQKLNLEEL